MTASFFIVRHGESTWNVQRRWQGQSDPPLSELGERQARRAASELYRLGRFDRIVTSSLRRARCTGELLAAETGIRLEEPTAALSERSAGPWEGLTQSEIDERFPGYLRGGIRPAGYESDESVVARALAALESLAAESTVGRWLVVSHGGVIRALEGHVDVVTSELHPLDNLEGRWFLHVEQTLRAVGGRFHLLDSTPVVQTEDYV